MFKQMITKYFDSWWLPTAIFFATLALSIILTVTNCPSKAIIKNILFIFQQIAFLGILSAAIWNFIKKRWIKGILTLVTFPVCVMVFIILPIASLSDWTPNSEEDDRYRHYKRRR